MLLKLSNIRTDGGTQTRVALNEEVVQEYVDAISNGRTTTFPDIDVFYDGENYWLADGFHRLEAFKRAGREKISAHLHQGTQRDAVLCSVGANSNHGLRRTNEDKRRGVMVLLEDPDWSKWSDREIARRCGVDNAFVSKLRKESSVDGQQIEARQVTRNGTTYTMTIPPPKRPAGPKNPPFKAFCPTCNRTREDWQYLEALYSIAHHKDVRVWQCPDCSYRAYQDAPGNPVYFIFLALYAVDDEHKKIYVDPIPSTDKDKAPHYYPDCGFLEGHLLQSEREHFAAFELCAPDRKPLPPPQPTAAELIQTRYQLGMMARCGKCEGFYGIENALYNTWGRDNSGANPIWICPHKHRVADSLMDIVIDDPPTKQDSESTTEAGTEQDITPAFITHPGIDAIYESIEQRIEAIEEQIGELIPSFGPDLIQYCKLYNVAHDPGILDAILNIALETLEVVPVGAEEEP